MVSDYHHHDVRMIIEIAIKMYNYHHHYNA